MPCSSRWAQRPGNLCRLQGLTQLWLDQNSIGDAGARRPGVADVVLEQKSSARPPRPELLHRCCSPAIGLERQLRGLQMPCSSRWAQRPGNLCRLQGLTQLWLDQNSIGDAGARRPGVADVVLEQKSSARPPRPELLHRCCSPAIGLERQLRGLQMPCSSRWAQRPGNLCRLQGLTQLWLDQNSIGDAGARRPGVADVVLEQKSSARPPRPELLHRCCSPAIGLERQLRGLCQIRGP